MVVCTLFNTTKMTSVLILLLLHLQSVVVVAKQKMWFMLVSVGNKYEVEVESGLDENKGLEILALYTDNRLQGLPEEARSIVRECKGPYSCRV